MSKVPTPRFDLLKMRHYAFGSLQFSRGCPFQCEFCDIIVTFGRRPRIKTAPQVIAELEAIAGRGMRIVFVVDDNLIGNKKAIKEVLRDVIAWQERNGYPLTFFTEASIDLADDPELMRADGRGQLHRHLHRHREPERGVAPRDQEVPERPLGRDDAGEGPPHPGGRHGGLVRHDHGFDNDDARIFEPRSSSSRNPDRLLDERHALRRSPRRRCTTARRRGAARHGGRPASSAPT